MIERQKSNLIRIGMKTWVYMPKGVYSCGDYITADVLQKGNKKIATKCSVIFNKCIDSKIDSISDSEELYEKPYLEKKFYTVLYLLGKKTLAERLMKKNKAARYTGNPFLLYLDRLTDYTFAESVSNILKTPIDTQEKVPAFCYRILEDAYYQKRKNSVPVKDIIQKVKADTGLDISEQEFRLNRHIVISEGMAYMKWVYFLQKRVLNMISVQQTYMNYTDSHDDERIQKLLSYRYSVLTGPPGSGKTTLIRKILSTYKGKVIVTATTGKAAKNINPEGGTLHYLLGYKRGRFTTKELNCDLLIVDEASMLNLQALYATLKAARGQIIFSGDDEQLPPVEGESVFSLLKKHLPVVELTGQYRRKNEKIIVIEKENIKDIYRTIKSMYEKLIRQGSVVVLSPVYDGPLGINNINKLLSYKGLLHGIATKNIYMDGQLLVANGETVTVLDSMTIKKDGRIISVSRGDILPAYALSVHRAIGSEYDNVIFVVPHGINEEFLNDELFYVATTRARYGTYVILQISQTV